MMMFTMMTMMLMIAMLMLFVLARPFLGISNPNLIEIARSSR